MDYIIAEATSLDQVTDSHGNKLYQARELTSASYKFSAITKILESNPVSYFLKMGRLLANYLNSNHPLVFVTDWSDPTELTGLRLETEDGFKDYPDLCFMGFYTDWDSIEQSGINEIFAHEFSHVWLNWMGYDPSRSLSNKFHTCTAITDPYMAFFEGFAEHLEIVTRDMSGYTQNGLWDYAYDVNAWLCARDTQLRYHGVINDRFTDSNLNHTGIYLYSKGKIMIHLTFDYQSDEGCTTPGQYLRYHRTFQGLTTRELAEKVGVVPATLVLYENDRHPIKHSTAVALANVLGIDRSRLLDEYTVFVDYPYSSLLKKVRRELSFTQMQMAEVIGIGQTTYSGWEREVRVPRRKEHEKILAAMKKLKVDVDTYLCQPNPL